MEDLMFNKDGRPIKPIRLKWYETVLLSVNGIIVGLLIGLLLFRLGAIQ